MKFSINNFFSKYDQIREKLWILSHLLRKFSKKNFLCSDWSQCVHHKIFKVCSIIFLTLCIKGLVPCHSHLTFQDAFGAFSIWINTYWVQQSTKEVKNETVWQFCQIWFNAIPLFYFKSLVIFKSSHQVFFKKAVLKNFAKFLGKHLC